jgi:hypothetical protein
LRDLNNNDNDILIPENPGFNLFDLEGTAGTVEDAMNAWTSPGNYDYGVTPIEILIDHIDQSPGVATAACPTTPRELPRPDLPSAPPAPPLPNYDYRQVPPPTGTLSLPNLTSFYACVDTDKTTAQVFIRGNALARIKPKGNPPTYNAGQSAYFPKATIQAQGRGLLTQNQTGQ